MNSTADKDLAARITRAASLQTYFTVRYLVDKELRSCAYQAYAYFRWVDDQLDCQASTAADHQAFIQRQKNLLEKFYRGESVSGITPQEELLLELIRCNNEYDSGLQKYIQNMMDVMVFDAGRRGRWITHHELSIYTRQLATAVTEALHFFIGHSCPAPDDSGRYLCAAGAHVTHMLRDTFEDVQAGYFNIPVEFLTNSGLDPTDPNSPGYREWVKLRVELARRYFEAGKQHLLQVASLRCRLAGYAYVARFEQVLDTIAKDRYSLRPEYRDLDGPPDLARISSHALFQALRHRELNKNSLSRAVQ